MLKFFRSIFYKREKMGKKLSSTEDRLAAAIVESARKRGLEPWEKELGIEFRSFTVKRDSIPKSFKESYEKFENFQKLLEKEEVISWQGFRSTVNYLIVDEPFIERRYFQLEAVSKAYLRTIEDIRVLASYYLDENFICDRTYVRFMLKNNFPGKSLLFNALTTSGRSVDVIIEGDTTVKPDYYSLIYKHADALTARTIKLNTVIALALSDYIRLH